MNRLRQFWKAVAKVFDLPRRLRAVRDHRADPLISAPVLTASLFLGAVLRVPSFHQLRSETCRRGWQRLLGCSRSISDDTFGYGLEHARLEDLRGLLVAANQTLKRNKALEASKISGLLVVSIDANEQFHSQSRCCGQCGIRKVKQAGTEPGHSVEVTEYYHRHVYAQLHGPHLSVILDLEPIAPGEDESAAALRLLGRMRRLYGPRFFDVVSVDAWYATGPFIKAVQRLGWATVTVLKQERYDIYQEATALGREQKPITFKQEERTISLREIKNLGFTDPAIGLMRVVMSEEHWTENRRVGGRKSSPQQQSNWRWLASRELDCYDARTVWQIGHQRWGIENHAFNELTQHYHLEHCPRHEPVAIVGWLLILVLGFVLFEWYARVHGKLIQSKVVTLQELARQLSLDLARWEELVPLWSG